MLKNIAQEIKNLDFRAAELIQSTANKIARQSLYHHATNIKFNKGSGSYVKEHNKNKTVVEIDLLHYPMLEGMLQLKQEN